MFNVIRENQGLAFLKSAVTPVGCQMATSKVQNWLSERKRAAEYLVREIPFSEFESWQFDNDYNCLAHRTGKFFTIRGVQVSSELWAGRSICQPIIIQREIGILGIVTKKVNGILHFLMQAKIEPGNVNGIQISPTVQATKSNYMQVHKGNKPRYLEYFFEGKKSRVLFDQLQSEQNGFFYKKRNRNIIVEINEDIEIHPDFCWLTLGQLKDLMKIDNLVNMDTRSVLSMIAYHDSGQGKVFFDDITKKESFAKDLYVSMNSSERACFSIFEILSWFTDQKTKQELDTKIVSLSDLKGWAKNSCSIQNDRNDYFSVIGVSIRTNSREVSNWTQPLIKANKTGLNGFLLKKINGIVHFLVQARAQPGCLDIVEMAPSVQYLPGDPICEMRQDFGEMLNFINSVSEDQVILSSVQSEEGGRFYHYQNVNKIVILKDDDLPNIPENYIWMTLGQMTSLIQYPNIFNMETRSLLACLGFN